jgi:hypothetical protein
MILICYSNQHWFCLFEHHSSLQQYVLDYVWEKKTVATIVPWDQWDPQKSRMLLGEGQIWNRSVVYYIGALPPNKDFSVRHHDVHGERVALPLPDANSVEILDFNIIPGRDGAAADTPSSTRFATKLQFGPSALRLDGIFKDTVVTSLPYQGTLRSLDEECDVFLIDQDRIIGINISVGAFHIE